MLRLILLATSLVTGSALVGRPAATTTRSPCRDRRGTYIRAVPRCTANPLWGEFDGRKPPTPPPAALPPPRVSFVDAAAGEEEEDGKAGRLFTATMMVAGNMVGGGVLAMPTLAMAPGFAPTVGALVAARIRLLQHAAQLGCA